MKKLITIIAATIVLASCSVTGSPVSFQSQVVKFPLTNEIKSEELGNTLVEYANLSSASSFEITRDYKCCNSMGGSYLVVYKQKLKPTVIDQKGNRGFEAEYGGYGGLAPNGSYSLPAQVDYYIEGMYAGKGLCFENDNLNMQKECIPPEYFVESDYYDYSQPNVKQQLIYNGRTGDYVKFLYREISQGMYLRPSFSQEVQYDLKAGTEIGFKGARLEIIEATNRNITYKVLSHFNPVE